VTGVQTCALPISPVWGVLAPANTPAPIVAKLEGWFMQINQLEATRRFLSITHAAPRAGDAKTLADFIPKEIEKWRELSKLANIRPQ
jgi:tripartite-type tricarboxylate transporter receptor subunit TctC